ncbi:hypothetical protein BPT24_126 [Tenacibaculum phage pT24]|uniref:Uncharacterized protein n=1 Tax=Tenacibaculum phage pT24 TaxID=1880590 RepID=A0A1B4XWR0_9CAUD|nr:hypothetical protein HYP10_gp126 [Tenacibaculum phage pT24]BAV39251.1 hypothetical protein BPT24_126 [Tenacibaculum phage pT24]
MKDLKRINKMRDIRDYIKESLEGSANFKKVDAVFESSVNECIGEIENSGLTKMIGEGMEDAFKDINQLKTLEPYLRRVFIVKLFKDVFERTGLDKTMRAMYEDCDIYNAHDAPRILLQHVFKGNSKAKNLLQPLFDAVEGMTNYTSMFTEESNKLYASLEKKTQKMILKTLGIKKSDESAFASEVRESIQEFAVMMMIDFSASTYIEMGEEFKGEEIKAKLMALAPHYNKFKAEFNVKSGFVYCQGTLKEFEKQQAMLREQLNNRAKRENK